MLHNFFLTIADNCSLIRIGVLQYEVIQLCLIHITSTLLSELDIAPAREIGLDTLTDLEN